MTISDFPLSLKPPYRIISANNPINFIDPEGLWSISVEFYAKGGGGIVFGKNPDGDYFLSIRGGYGLGGGIAYDPKGTSPGWDPCIKQEGVPMFGIGGYGELSAGFGPFFAGVNANIGVHQLIAYRSLIFLSYVSGAKLTYGLGTDWSFKNFIKSFKAVRAGGAAGVEMTIYF